MLEATAPGDSIVVREYVEEVRHNVVRTTWWQEVIAQTVLQLVVLQ